MDCIFCKIVAGQIPCLKVYENGRVLAFLDIGPLSDGHTLVIPKEHYARLEDLPAELAGEIGKVLPKLGAAVVRAVGAPGYNVLQNNGRVAGQLVEHVHFHIIPRQPEDGLGYRWNAKKYPEGKDHQVLQRVVAELENP